MQNLNFSFQIIINLTIISLINFPIIYIFFLYFLINFFYRFIRIIWYSLRHYNLTIFIFQSLLIINSR
jgi:hypothetical protein